MSFANPTRFIKSIALLSITMSAGLFTQVEGAIAPAPVLKSINLGWDAVPETDVQNYRVYVGNLSGQYVRSQDSGNNLSVVISDLEYGRTYYFAVAAINNAGRESLLSTQLVVSVTPPALPLGGGIGTNTTGALGLQWSYPISSMNSSPEFLVESSTDLNVWTLVATVLPSASIGEDAQSKKFSWPIDTTGKKRFYRLTARDWMGTSTAQ